MKYNEKYLIKISKKNYGFKELFTLLADGGAGRPVDRNGFPIGHWTPDLLADAISQIDDNKAGVNVRTVQLWFEDNDRIISDKNIGHLAIVFGCGNASATNDIRKKMHASKRQRKADRREQKHGITMDSSTLQNTTPTKLFSLARKSEALFHGRNSFNLTILLWCSVTLLGVLSYSMGVGDVTYSPFEGLEKQVGFSSAISWTISPILILPIYISLVIKLKTLWTNDIRPDLMEICEPHVEYDTWEERVESFSFSFWFLFVLSFGVIFILQWSGVHLRALLQGDPDKYMMDWNIVALVRPDVITIPESIMLSMSAYLFYGFVMWLLFLGLLFLCIISNDFYHIYNKQKNGDMIVNRNEMANQILYACFQCVILSTLFCICIKLQSTYLLSDGVNIFSWFINDALFVFGLQDSEHMPLDQMGVPQFTTIILLAVNLLVFLICSFQISWPLKNSNTAKSIEFRKNFIKMAIIILLLQSNIILIGKVSGFSIIFLITLMISIVSLFSNSLKALDE